MLDISADVRVQQQSDANLQDELLRHLTSDERRQLLDLTQRAKQRMKEKRDQKAIGPVEIETTAHPVSSEEDD